ncbi:glycoside hydrolase family 3 N-terminal domain-containing protein [Pontibacter sp. G13]|uniref:glycoside hydrolase family 3 N-terminal domain-containing protein n=1 Tax=Pontibacter sp. G13 TaxID=3074898 RepID=UPI002889FAF7|nr:glycoside hydrolase family 3 N-terminal domain-containing protein [Pontibacter sp. G13]WNJ20882.1 glycoside hydrolase family 3 N-terminal domain-containing protein [Pontibacter sp. G13]
MNNRMLKAIGLCLAFMIHQFPLKAQTLVDSLLQVMTLEEKLGQLQQLDGGNSREELEDLIRNGQVGSILNEVNSETLWHYQQIARNESRLGIPLLIGRDVIHGYRTIFPIPLATSASWNLELVEEGSQVAAREASSAGVNWTFAPMIDVARDPRWGRIAESPGEDPYLTTEMGLAMVRGFQGDDMSQPGRIAACAKHFAAYGLAEGGRDYNTVSIGDRVLREVYLRPFHALADAGIGSFMTSFNELNDIPASGNTFLLRDQLKGDWQFPGMVVSDWESITEMIKHGYCQNPREAAFRAMTAGVDMEMTSTSYQDHLPELLAEGAVSMELVDDAVRRILEMKYKLGLFSADFSQPFSPDFLRSEELELARQAAVESFVLLKRDLAILPLTTQKTIAVIGPMADAPHEQLGTWVFDGKKTDSQTPLAALQTRLGESVKIHFAPGISVSRDKSHDGFATAIKAAKKSDVVLFFAGEESIISGEAHSRAHLDLPGAQPELLTALAETGKPIILVVLAGRPLIMTEYLPQVDACIYAWHPGTMAGPALVDVLLGQENPSGKLPVTFPRSEGQIPMYYAHKHTGRPASAESWVHIDSIPVEAWQTSLGNTSHYLDEGFTPLFPFGFGLSYTDFEYQNLQMSAKEITNQDTLWVSVDLKNVGPVAGKEVVQLYIQDEFGSVTRPVKELKAFQKVTLDASEEMKVTFPITVKDLSFFRSDMTFGAETGTFNLWIGGSSDSGLKGSFSLSMEGDI